MKYIMKVYNFFVLLLLLFLIAASSSAQTNIVERPYYKNTNSEYLFVNKLELTDSQTILHCDVYNLPKYWVNIASDIYLKGESGKIYNLLKSEGFELGKKVPMPESGTMAFQLHFEPLDKEENTFDVISGETKISGIHTSNDIKFDAPIHCIIKGEVIDRPESNILYLIKKGGDMKVNKMPIAIKDGKFMYHIAIDQTEPYELIFVDEVRQGGWRPVAFFAENGTIEMKLYPMDRDNENTFTGSPLTTDYYEFNKSRKKIADILYTNECQQENLNSLDSHIYTNALRALITANTSQDKDLRKEYRRLNEEGLYLNKEAQTLLDSARACKEREEQHKLFDQFNKLRNEKKHMTPQALELDKKFTMIESLIGDWELQYMKDHISLMSYEKLIYNMDLSLSTYPIYDHAYGKTGEYIQLYNTIYSKKYPDHPLTQKMKDMIESYMSVKVGGKYIDFTAPDFNGNPVTLSEQIKGKIALIDLWASWCGPCRRLSKTVIPVYEEYKNKGFTVIGIAREEKAEYAINAAEKDNYPWLNLIELNDKGQIWQKYGAGNSGGETFLVDRDGTILAIHPSADEIRKILEEKLK